MSDSEDKSITKTDVEAMIEGMLALHMEIASAIEQPQIEPSHLMRLLAAGVNQCLVALITILMKSEDVIPVSEKDG